MPDAVSFQLFHPGPGSADSDRLATGVDDGEKLGPDQEPETQVNGREMGHLERAGFIR